MGSVSDEVVCPNCKRQAEIEVYYRRGEHYLFCPTCGYHEESNAEGIKKGGGRGAFCIQYRQCVRLGSFHTRKPLHKRFTPGFIARRRVLAITVTERVRGKWKSIVLKAEQGQSVRDWKGRMTWRNRPRSTSSMDIEF